MFLIIFIEKIMKKENPPRVQIQFRDYGDDPKDYEHKENKKWMEHLNSPIYRQYPTPNKKN